MSAFPKFGPGALDRKNAVIFLGQVGADRHAPLPGLADQGRGVRSADFYFRQLRDWKYSAEIEGMNAAAMTGYGRMCGWTLAPAHARTGDRIAIAAYLSGSGKFDQAVAGFAESQVRLPVLLVFVQGPGDRRGLFLSHLRLSLGPYGLGLRGLLLGPVGLRPGPFGLPRRLTPGVAAEPAVRGTRPALGGQLGIVVDAPGDSPRSPGRAWSAPRLEVSAPEPVHAGIDGEAVQLSPPLWFAIRPAALRVRISSRHPGASPSARLRLPGHLARSHGGRE
jgi:Uncharacterized protein conserved in bacteria (DUF2252)